MKLYLPLSTIFGATFDLVLQNIFSMLFIRLLLFLSISRGRTVHSLDFFSTCCDKYRLFFVYATDCLKDALSTLNIYYIH